MLGYYLRNDIDTSKLIAEIKSIASNPTEKYFFNVSEEAVLIEIVGTLGDRIFNIEGPWLCRFYYMLYIQVHLNRLECRGKVHLVNWWVFVKMWAKILTIKITKDLNYFSLCALNLFNTWVSQFELNYWNKWTFPRHSLLRYTCK